ncbi:hypothetical protein QQG74_21085 [Micromonospora sp. FIMYZ51]|uniref:hypothetical protein n=1 Tax=Micromonospora sp. FIMYZ51 TaxID=3051832 RepID=UPI00311FB572
MLLQGVGPDDGLKRQQRRGEQHEQVGPLQAAIDCWVQSIAALRLSHTTGTYE